MMKTAPATQQFGSEVVDFRGYFKADVYPHGAAIIRPGEALDRVFILKRGRVHMVRSGQRTKLLIAILRAGDLFGDLGLSKDDKATEYAFSQGESEIWSIETEEFAQLLAARPSLARDVIVVLNQQIRDLQQKASDLTGKEVPARLASTLLSLGRRLGERCPHNGEVDLRGITQQDIADLVGASRSFISTLVNEMKRDGYLGNVGRILCIRDTRALEKIAAKRIY